MNQKAVVSAKLVLVLALLLGVGIGTAAYLGYEDYAETVDISVQEIEGGTVEGAGSYRDGDTVTLTAAVDHGYRFSCWTEDGMTVGNNTTLTFTASEDRELRAVFVLRSYTVTVASNYADAGTLTGAGTYTYQTVHTVAATVRSGYIFEGWYEDGRQLSSASSMSYTVKDDCTLTARYAIIHDASFTISVTAAKVPLTLTAASVYNVQIKERTWACTDALTGASVWLYHIPGVASVSHSFTTGEGLVIKQSVTYTDGETAVSTQNYVVDETVAKHFEWKYKVKTWYSDLTPFINNRSAEWNLNFSYAWYYSYLTNNSIPRTGDYSWCAGYATYADPVIVSMAGGMTRFTASLSDAEKVNCVLKFVQSFAYEYDSDGKQVGDYCKYPAETLYEGKGDCEDHAFLFAALTRAMGYQTAIYYLYCYADDGSFEAAHMAAGVNVSGISGYHTVFNGINYYYCEATATHSAGLIDYCDVGDLPTGYVIKRTWAVT